METRVCPINNAFYDYLGHGWVSADDHPIALLRAENRVRNPWISRIVDQHFPEGADVLDVGCGAGFLTHTLAAAGHRPTGLDLSSSSLEVARQNDATGKARYVEGSAIELPFPDRSFDVVCAMDLLEHVEDPARVIAEASRVLRPGGLFFFHTFNRNPLSWFLIIKGVDWFVPQAIENMHVYSLFIRPQELETICADHQLCCEEWRGLIPDWTHRSFWRLVFTRRIASDFRFRFVESLATGYCGYARKHDVP
jgi:2-polyprenyl-6-hydroxyphenyl methylase/3-demethylubiquinone-9 3-methyltransferase